MEVRLQLCWKFATQPAIVRGWRYDYRFDKALALGLKADTNFEENVRYYIEDDLPNA